MTTGDTAPPLPGPARRSFPTLRTVGALVLREMSARYGQSPGGYLWAFLSPLLMIAALTIAFSFLQKTPRLGTSFIMYYASGHLVFAIFGQVGGPVTQSLKFSRSLLRFPTVIWLDTVLARFALNALTATAVYFILLYAIAAGSGHGLRFDLPPVLLAVALAVALAFGFGVLTCYLFMELPIAGRLWGFAARPLFIVSGVLFLYEDFPPRVQDVLWWNPLMHITSIAKAGIFQKYDPNWTAPLYVLTVALVLAVAGLFLLRQHHDRLLNGGK
ncbi:ABC transporter permease [Maritimibacter sp. UBA3975]|uniref:ABC transporter permease n=1 Tax=Maritimibacter sp. UBA3975 TaxID=1946833 RepID=UPI0025C5371B|nr:ABC transporter permease [Maritimibacter sp. UBA3975]|tara:strand:- start:6650 stop:7465 length:816 start_codon:yes stop_codon:yes gene_type:complete